MSPTFLGFPHLLFHFSLSFVLFCFLFDEAWTRTLRILGKCFYHWAIPAVPCPHSYCKTVRNIDSDTIIYDLGYVCSHLTLSPVVSVSDISRSVLNLTFTFLLSPVVFFLLVTVFYSKYLFWPQNFFQPLCHFFLLPIQFTFSKLYIHLSSL